MKYKIPKLIVLVAACCIDSVLAYNAPFSEQVPQIDGEANELAWSKAEWASIDQLTLGEMPSSNDFSGRFKVIWTEQRLYFIAEIVDDILIDTHADPLVSYWEDDTFEVFIDEDNSGGEHLNNYNAFAYHIALDNQVVDINEFGQPQLFNDHVKSAWKRSSEEPNKVVWEVSVDIYSDSYSAHAGAEETIPQPVTLSLGKKLGFLVAYCDSDDPSGRQHFIGSIDVPAINGNKNRAYIDADVFGTLQLTK